MKPEDRLMLLSLLRLWERQDFGDMHNYLHGLWDRRGLEAMIDDLHSETNADAASTVR